MQIEKGIAEFNLANGKGNQHTQEFIRRMGETPQCFNNRCKRGVFRILEMEKIAKAFNADLKIIFVDKRTGLPIA